VRFSFEKFSALEIDEMADNRGVWGIDIGQAGLKAIRLRYAEAAQQALAVAFDYVPHPKILSQPDAVPDELIAQALQTFLSRNDLKGDVVCISVPGQSALARFIQLPPVEQGKVHDIVKYEAKQQIPFALEEVIWDYQTLGAGSAEGGFLLDAEVGLFAMKRDQVLQQLRPFLKEKVEVELIQIAPLGLYNFLSYDRMGIRLGEEAAPPSDEYSIILDMGADNTTLLVSNGVKIWIRNVPIGGNHFTRALTKEMKLTFAKAEHLKCNATKAPDPRAVFQALRPVFNDYVSEIQRSIGYFSSVNRDAKITKVLGLGNGFKLAGLQKYLQQNLQYDVEKIDTFQGLAGDTVLKAPLFEENILSFAVPYGLALQGLNLTRIHTTLLPQEIATARKIRKKKPWAAVTAATLLVGLAGSAVGYGMVYKSVSEDRWKDGESKVASLQSEVTGYKTKYGTAEGENKKIMDEGALLVGNLETREQWLEVYKAINQCLPRDQKDDKDESDPTKKNRIKINAITCKKTSDFTGWYTALPQQAKLRMLPAPSTEQTEAPKAEADKPAYLFRLEGVHYHDSTDPDGRGDRYVITTLLSNLQKWTVQAQDTPAVPVRKLGISHATVTQSPPPGLIRFSPDSGKRNLEKGRLGGPMGPGGGVGNALGGIPMPMAGGAGLPPAAGGGGGRPVVLPGDKDEVKSETRDIPRTTFIIEFAWIPTPVAKRLDVAPEVAKAMEAAGASAPAGDAAGATPGAAAPAATATPSASPAPTSTPPGTAPAPGAIPMPGSAPTPPPPGATPAVPAPGAAPPAGASGGFGSPPPAAPPAAGAIPPAAAAPGGK
jgi:type IV pilus assembly protein PilM